MADLHPVRIPGYYYDGPFSRRPDLLDKRLFWMGLLYSCASGPAGAMLFGPGYGWNEHRQFQSRLWAQGDWPTFAIPLAADHRLYVVFRTLEDGAGIDYLIHHPDWDQAELVARVDPHFQVPGLSWPELASAADNGLPGGIDDPHARLLLLLPSFSDDAVPEEAVDRLASALRTRLGVAPAEPVATALLESQGPAGPARWTTTGAGMRINSGRYSLRNPANSFAMTSDRLVRVAHTLAP